MDETAPPPDLMAPELMAPGPMAAPLELAPHAAVPDLSPVALFMAADPVVKGVMLLLVLASVACWAIILDKWIRIAALRHQARRFERGEAGARGMAGEVLGAGRSQAQEHDPGESRAERRERIERAMRETARRHLRAAEPGLPVLATIGSAGPFIGLLGTVWGIMRSFTAIAATNETSLAVVAPGIAEALFATAVGLAAAIPAVVAYNKLATDLGRLGQRFGAAIDELGARLAREPGAHLARAAE